MRCGPLQRWITLNLHLLKPCPIVLRSGMALIPYCNALPYAELVFTSAEDALAGTAAGSPDSTAIRFRQAAYLATNSATATGFSLSNIESFRNRRAIVI